MKKNIIRLAALCLLLAIVPELALAADFAVVTGGRLNLRQYASSDSYSLGKYASGSWVEIKGSGSNGFTYVKTMDGKTGYMSSNYLNTAAGANSATVRYANGGYVNLRSGPALTYSVVMRVTSGTQVRIENDTYEWNYISLTSGGQTVYGYMHDSFLNRSTSAAVVTTKNGGKVNVRSGPDSDYTSIGRLASGTQVSILLKGNGWYYVSGGGVTGFMSTQYLSGSGSTIGSNTGSSSGSSGTTSVSIAYVSNPKNTQVLNLREAASQSSRSIGQYRNGTQVRVVSYGTTWCEVYVGTKHGYMMTRYLSFDGNYVQPAPTSTPSYVYPLYPQNTATPDPLIALLPVVTPLATPQPSYSTSTTPHAGMYAWLAISSNSIGNSVSVYANAELTQLKAVYSPGQQVMILSYGPSVSLILVGGEAVYVSSQNLNY